MSSCPIGRALTKDGPGRHRLSVEPEGDLGEDDGHDAGQVRLDHKVADFPLQVELSRHDCVFTWRRSCDVAQAQVETEGSALATTTTNLSII